jgi:hypothetical protein
MAKNLASWCYHLAENALTILVLSLPKTYIKHRRTKIIMELMEDVISYKKKLSQHVLRFFKAEKMAFFCKKSDF